MLDDRDDPSRPTGPAPRSIACAPPLAAGNPPIVLLIGRLAGGSVFELVAIVVLPLVTDESAADRGGGGAVVVGPLK